MRDPGKVRNSQVAELSIDGVRIALVVIDEFFGLDDSEELRVAPREVGLFGLDRSPVALFNEPAPGCAVVPRSRSTRPWLRAKKGRARQ